VTNISLAIWTNIQTFVSRLREEHGQDTLEWALIGGLMAVALVAAFLILRPEIVQMATNMGACVDFDSTSPCIAGP